MKNILKYIQNDLTQSKMIELFFEQIKEEGTLFFKLGGVFARPAVDGEIIYTIIDGIQETQNIAKSGDFVVINSTKSQEEYILTADKISKRYEITDSSSHKEGYAFYKAKGVCIALEYTSSIANSSEFSFMASWSESMVCKYGDYLVCPVNNGVIEQEIYRIEKSAFE